MSRFFKNGFAIIRGGIFFFLTLIFRKTSIKCGVMLAKYKGAYLRVSKGSFMRIGSGVKVGEDTMISTLNGGRLEIEDHVSIGRWNAIVCHKNIYIGRGTIFGPNVLVYDHDHVFNGTKGVEKKKFNTEPITIGKNCWIGANVVILKGTKIGDRCVVGAGCVLKGSYSDDSLIIQERQTKVTQIERKSE